MPTDVQSVLVARRKRRAAQARALWQRCLASGGDPERCRELRRKWMQEERALVMSGGESEWVRLNEDGGADE